MKPSISYTITVHIYIYNKLDVLWGVVIVTFCNAAKPKIISSFRYGFNSVGHETVFGRLSAVRSDEGGRVNAKIGVNLGKNKTSADPVKDYVDGVKKFANVADYLVVNVSRFVEC